MITIAEPDPHWADEFDSIAGSIRVVADPGIVRIDHVGSTSVPLAAKDVIDVQITAADDENLERIAASLAAQTWRRSVEIDRDHQVPGFPTSPAAWRKAFFVEPEGERRIDVQVRVQGRANQRYACSSATFSARIWRQQRPMRRSREGSLCWHRIWTVTPMPRTPRAT